MQEMEWGDEMGWTRGTCGGEEECIQNLGGKPQWRTQEFCSGGRGFNKLS